MKAEIDENGVLTVTSEAPIEDFALREWNEKAEIRFKDENTDGGVFIRGGRFITVYSIDEETKNEKRR